MKMSLQLYQVDYKSFLLDFKSLPTDEENQKADNGGSNPDLAPDNEGDTFGTLLDV